MRCRMHTVCSKNVAGEVECIGKGKAHAPYEFGVKVSVAITLNRVADQFVTRRVVLTGFSEV